MCRLISLLACSSVERHSEGGRLAAPAESQSAPRATCQWELLWSVAVWECGRVGHTTLGPRQNRPREPARPNHAHAGHLHRPRIMSATPGSVASETPSRSVFLGEAGADTNCILKYDRVEFGIEHLCPRSTAKLSHTENRTAPTPRAPACIASLDELEPRPLYSEPELCGGRVEGDEQLAHRD